MWRQVTSKIHDAFAKGRRIVSALRVHRSCHQSN